MSSTTIPDIRIVPPEEFVTLGVGAYAFGKSPQKPDLERQRARLAYVGNSVGLAAYDGSDVQAACVVHAMTENIRGSILPMGGIGGVASFPQARRKGHVRAMLAHCYQVMRERGQPVSALYPFRDSFYERLGYAEMPKTRFTRLKPEHLSPLLREDLPGTVTQLGIEHCFDEWRGFVERIQAKRHGFSLAERERAVESRDTNEYWVAIVREEGEITGAMTFTITGYTEALRAGTFHTTTPAARYQLLAWIARHVDQVSEAIIELGPDAYPELWYRDLVAQTNTEDQHAWPAPMGRVISVEGLAGIGAGGDASITIDIADEFCPWNARTWTLTGNGGVLDVREGGEAACELTIQGLSALVWSGIDPATFRYRGWGDPTPEAQCALRALFPPALPILHEKF